MPFGTSEKYRTTSVSRWSMAVCKTIKISKKTNNQGNIYLKAVAYLQVCIYKNGALSIQWG